MFTLNSLARLLLSAALFLQVILIFSSCTSARKINYFYDIVDSVKVTLPPMEKEDRRIQKGDVIDISFSAREEDAVKPFNRAPSGSTSATTGYLVNDYGIIELPVIGKLAVDSFTIAQLKDTLLSRVRTYLNEPLVNVKFNSFRVTLLGEVRSPGTYTLSPERTTILEALAAAGDLPVNARKYDLELYRDYNGNRTISKINLTNSKIFNDPYKFQMKPNDVVYVRTRSSSVFREDFTFFSAIATLILTMVTLGFTLTN